MNIIDFILIILLFFSVIAGYKDGFVKELASLAGLVLGIYAAIHFSDVTADFIREFLNISGKYVPIFAFILTMVVVILLMAAIAKIFESVLETIMLGFLNKIAGAVFGLLKGMLILSLLIMLLGFLNVENRIIKPKFQEGSRFYGDVKGFAPFAFQFFDLDEKLEELKDWGKEKEENINKAV